MAAGSSQITLVSLVQPSHCLLALGWYPPIFLFLYTKFTGLHSPVCPILYDSLAQIHLDYTSYIPWVLEEGRVSYL